VKSILAGQDERLDWIALNKYINDCLPRVGFVEKNGKLEPDPNAVDPRLRLTDKQRAKYWNDAARTAHLKFLEREGGLRGGEGKVEEDEGVDNLVQINVEAIDCTFVDSLEAYFSQLGKDTYGSTKYGMQEADQKTPPTGKGWLVEIRGYTYHKERQQFVT